MYIKRDQEVQRNLDLFLRKNIQEVKWHMKKLVKEEK